MARPTQRSISTHTPLARRDSIRKDLKKYASNFYSHASCEARHPFCFPFMISSIFLLTRLLRGATRAEPGTGQRQCDFYSHASCEARHSSLLLALFAADFYSHASCEARPIGIVTSAPFCDFYSHASCEARLHRCSRAFSEPNFYSHASCEARLSASRVALTIAVFLLTRLLRGATYTQQLAHLRLSISTHTPLARRDCSKFRIKRTVTAFLLTRLLRGATSCSCLPL